MTPATEERLQQAILLTLPEYPKVASTQQIRDSLLEQGGWRIGRDSLIKVLQGMHAHGHLRKAEALRPYYWRALRPD